MSAGVCRVAWVPGTDTLHGTCHCSAEFLAEDPVDLWTWMYEHRHDDPSPPLDSPDDPAALLTTGAHR
ncbi:hypothetical protein [Pseudonocardia yuanmonensis]|uniref:hypothetical protein n=1 Tax=Pseudonocardia yuanmonensis TaxID=1095914 RepID=UPI0031EFD2DB